MTTPYELEMIARQHQREILDRAAEERRARQALRSDRTRRRRPLADYVALGMATMFSASWALRELVSASWLGARRAAVVRLGIVH
ncbi:MAG TPA: hypothetical protein VFX49_23255 [Chloroflexota bacterium]|nr:hypothetical protein [Chloroflexota bacterium]